MAEILMALTMVCSEAPIPYALNSVSTLLAISAASRLSNKCLHRSSATRNASGYMTVLAFSTRSNEILNG